MVAVIGGVTQVVIEVEDQDRAKRFWTEQLGFELVQDAPYGEGRWLEVRTPDQAVVVVLAVRHGERPTYQELTARGVQFPQPPVQQPFGWWSLFADPDGNRFALVPREQ
jgi:predicted enzyme related to lactoylglutathione lyase